MLGRVRLVVGALLAVGVSVTAAPVVEAAPVSPRSPLCIEVPGGAPGDVAVINITNTDATADGYGALRASQASPIPSRPASQRYSSVNFARGEPNPNLTLVAIGSDGRSCYDSDGGSANVILDLVAIMPAANLNAIEPLRLRDTRDTGLPVAPRTPLCLTLPTSAAAGDVAVINITNTNATADGYGALRASDAQPIPSRPRSAQYSSVNYAPGRTDPNLALVTAGPDRGICYDSDGGTAHVILDLVAIIPANNIVATDPQRLTDTRSTGRQVEARRPLCVAVPAGTPGAAAVINITNTSATGPGYGALRSSQAQQVPSRATADQFSSVNFAPGATNPNLAVVNIGTDGRVCYDSDGGSTHVILDLVAIIPANNIAAIEPDRITDTRPAGTGINVTVTKVTDGDTIEVAQLDQPIRILGYDTPERGECGYDEATNRLTQILASGPVTLTTDNGDNTDRFGRYLRHVLVNGVPVGLTLISEGKANARYDSLDGYPRHRYQDQYRNADGPNTFNCTPPPTTTTPTAPPAPTTSNQPWNQPISATNPDLDCADIGQRVLITGPDYHRLDADGDGIGCESYG